MFGSLRPAARALSVTSVLAFVAAGCAEPGQEEGLATEEEPAGTGEADVPDFSEEVRTEFQGGPGASGEVDVPPLDRVWVRAGGLSVQVHAGPGVDHGATVACAIL